jgi:hypothetical protein
MCLNAETITSICALAVSIVSVVFTWLSLKYQREHNYKSVKPIGIIDIMDYESNLSVKITNCGVGPLIIKRVNVVNGTINCTNLVDLMPESMFAGRLVWTSFARDLEKHVIPNGQSIDLILWKPDKDWTPEINNDDRQKIRKALKDACVTLDYLDIYELNSYSVTLKLEWFGRHFK